MPERVITGGQTGADQAGLRAAKAFGIATGGFMPRGFLTEDGPRPDFSELYGAVECPDPGLYRARWRTSATPTQRCGSERRLRPARRRRSTVPQARRAHMVVDPGAPLKPSHLAAWLDQRRFRVSKRRRQSGEQVRRDRGQGRAVPHRRVPVDRPFVGSTLVLSHENTERLRYRLQDCPRCGEVTRCK
jgi:Circularly permutated YpsA SLOG family